MSDEEIFDLIELDLPIEQLDFGAGDPKDGRSAEVMSQGVIKKTTTKEMCRIGLKGEWAKKLYFLIKDSKPNVILELGTCCGFSSIYMSKANPQSSIYTIEGSNELANIAKSNRVKANCQNVIQKVGRFSDVLPTLLPDISPIDFAFIDGHHDRDATIRYFEQIANFMSKEGVMVFDDITWSDGMREAWRQIKESDKCELLEESEKFGIIKVSI